jgi:hypothetical protein
MKDELYKHLKNIHDYLVNDILAKDIDGYEFNYKKFKDGRWYLDGFKRKD